MMICNNGGAGFPQAGDGIKQYSDNEMDCLKSFHPIISEWFAEQFGEPSEPQKRGWPEIAKGSNVLICAPTGSGKTFAAFLKCLDWIYSQKAPDTKNKGVKIVYISPLKALNNDIYRNLELPIRGISRLAAEKGLQMPEVEIAVRTGDTPQKERTRMLKSPPDILITTPESLYIMLTSESYRKLFTTAEYLIVDEIHSICASKRGVHLSVTLERLERVAGKPLKRIGLTATINPIEEAAHFLVGCRSMNMPHDVYASIPRNIEIINCDRRRDFELTVSLPVKDLKVLPENTVWPSIFSELLALTRAHKSTLIFVNNRRVAELVSSGLNNLADEPFVKTHHGSISKEVRQELERQLKAGELTCLVATSSLELGIDIGSIDLVVQISAPGSVSQVLQRIGRSGHKLSAVSRGVVIPKTRGDLLDSSFMSYQAKRYEIENIKVPQNCLDILAQQITSISCEGEQEADAIYSLVRCSYAYRDLPRKQFDDVLLMLSDPSPSEAPGSMKPRIFLDRSNGKVRGTPTGRRMCLMSGGTIPDKGNYPVYLKDTGVKLGDLQEEFIFESRLGDRFFLGSSVWKLEKIEKDRVLVSPSTASGAKIPFWQGDKILRTYETGKMLGQFLEKLETLYDNKAFFDFMTGECGLDRTAAENLKYYIADQVEDTGHLPGASRIICEYFSDETGDRRIIIHSTFGGQIHAPLAVLLHSKLTKLLNCRMEYVYNNDGILFHIFGYTGKLSNLFSLIDRENLEDEIFELLPDAPLFNIQLRYNLMRSLLVEMNGFGKRTPLWIQRLRCAEVAGSVLSKPDHPVVVETYRECMNDIFDIQNLYDLIERISLGKVQVIDVYTETPSVFSSELLFNFWQIYQYAYDLPVAERRNQLLVNDRDFIQLAAGANGEYELLDPRAIHAVEKELLEYKFGRKISSADELYYFLFSFGELKASQDLDAVFSETPPKTIDSFLNTLETQRRAIRIPFGLNNELCWVAAEDYPLYCKAAGIDAENSLLMTGIPGNEEMEKASDLLSSYIFLLTPDEKDAAVRLIRRNVMCRGPFSVRELSLCYNMSRNLLQSALSALQASGEIVLLKDDPDEDEVIYCHRKVYERIKQRTVIMARSDIKPKDPSVYCSFLFNRSLLKSDVLPPDEKLLEVIRLLQGQYYPASWWEDFIFPSRIPNYEPKLLDYACATGSLRWVGRTNKSTREVAFFTAGNDEGMSFQPDEASGIGEARALSEPEENPSAFTLDSKEKTLLEIMDSRGALFLKELSKLSGLLPAELLAKMERLVWYGIVTNDSFSIARYYMDNDKKNSPWLKYNTYPSMGRWYRPSVQTSMLRRDLSAYINEILDRYGIISKEIMECEKGVCRWSDIYTWLKNNEFTSGIKRGLYISGLSGIQFARDRDIEQIRMQESGKGDSVYTVLCSCDPANPYKDILSKASPEKITKNQGTAVVFLNGTPVLIIREFGGSLQPVADNREILVNATAGFIDAFQSRMLWTGRKNIYTEYWRESAGEGGLCKIEDSPLYERLLDLGFERGYSGITLWRRSV